MLLKPRVQVHIDFWIGFLFKYGNVLKTVDISKMVFTLKKIAQFISTILFMVSLLFPINTWSHSPSSWLMAFKHLRPAQSLFKLSQRPGLGPWL